MSLEASTWSPRQAASAAAFFRFSRRSVDDPIEHARVALIPLCGPGATETVLHTALASNQPPSTFVDPLRGHLSATAAEERFLAAAPAFLQTGLLLTWLAALLLPFWGLRSPSSLLMAFAYSLAIYACFRVAHAVRSSRALHLAWICFGVSSAVSVVRHVLESQTFWNGREAHFAFLQIPIVAALLLVIAGLISMSRFFRQAGLGFRATALDWVLFAILIVSVPVTFSLRDTLPDAHSPYAVIRFFQSLSPILLAAVAIPAVLLHRITLQLEGGQLAGILRLLVAFAYLRAILLLIGRFLDPSQHSLAVQLVGSFFGVPAWLFALAAFRQWRLLLQKTT